MQIQEIINHIAAGESVAAKESIENVLSAKAFDALQGRKQEMAATLFGGQEQSHEEVTDDEEAYAEEVEHNGEQLDEVSMKLATKVNRMRRGESMDNSIRGDRDRSFDSSKSHTNTDGKYRSGDTTKSGYSKSVVSARHIAKKPGGQTRLDRIEKTSD